MRMASFGSTALFVLGFSRFRLTRLVAEKRRFIVTAVVRKPRPCPGDSAVKGPGVRFLRLGIIAIVASVGAAAAMAPLQRINAMSRVLPGLWTIHALDKGESDVAPFCVTDTARLLQFRHPGATCSRFIIADTDRIATIQYSCAGAGWGRTSVRVISPEMLRLDTQGIAGKAPFALAAEAHRVGDCHSQRASR